jgi:hypothetical protein
MYCCTMGVNYTYGHNCYNGNFAKNSGQRQCLTPSPMESCQGDPRSWDAGYGDCTTYANTSGANFKHCRNDVDQRTGKHANNVCPECGVCMADLCSDDNVAIGVNASSPDGYAAVVLGASGGADKVVDGDPNTFWDEAKGQPGPYIVELSKPQAGHLVFAGYSLQVYVTESPKSWTLLCDGNKIDEQSQFTSASDIYYKCMGTTFSCTTLRLSITSWYGGSPVIREFKLHSKQQACSVTDGSSASSNYPCMCGFVSCTTDQKCISESNLCQKPPTPAPPPTPPEALTTVLGEMGVGVCPDGYSFILDEATCNYAATAHQLLYKWTFSHASAPRGCCLDGTTGDVYFNTHSTGGEHPTGRLLCQQVPTSSPTISPTISPTNSPTPSPTSAPTPTVPLTVSPTPAVTLVAQQGDAQLGLPNTAVHYSYAVLSAAVSFVAAVSGSGIGDA